VADNYTTAFIQESADLLARTDPAPIAQVVDLLARTRKQGGRLFLCGSGGGAGHASHATCDFRKMAGFEAYCVTDNVSELTARTNDEGWDVAYANWLIGSRIRPGDCLFVFSVGGGDVDRNVSVNLVNAMRAAKAAGAAVTGIVGRDGGELVKLAECCIVIPPGRSETVTAQTEALQALFWHLLVTHPSICEHAPHWESLEKVDREIVLEPSPVT
jgi:D-sedoheptulose 7-phosphate isomerase